MLAAVIANVSGKTLKNSISKSVFVPDYLQERKKPVSMNKSIEQQQREMSDWAAKYKTAQATIRKP